MDHQKQGPKITKKQQPDSPVLPRRRSEFSYRRPLSPPRGGSPSPPRLRGSPGRRRFPPRRRLMDGDDGFESIYEYFRKISPFSKPMYAEMEEQRLRCANTALSFYNKKNPGAEYELVEALASNPVHARNLQLFYHVNFKAKRKNAAGSDSEPKLLFA